MLMQNIVLFIQTRVKWTGWLPERRWVGPWLVDTFCLEPGPEFPVFINKTPLFFEKWTKALWLVEQSTLACGTGQLVTSTYDTLNWPPSWQSQKWPLCRILTCRCIYNTLNWPPRLAESKPVGRRNNIIHCDHAMSLKLTQTRHKQMLAVSSGFYLVANTCQTAP